jgi:hypothetical protein
MSCFVALQRGREPNGSSFAYWGGGAALDGQVRWRHQADSQWSMADVKGASGRMSEVVVQISADEGRDPSRLTNAIDAFAKWAVESGLSTDSGDAPDIMMMTEFAGGEMRRKLVFQDREHAARFLVFWRVERQRSHSFEASAVGA